MLCSAWTRASALEAEYRAADRRWAWTSSGTGVGVDVGVGVGLALTVLQTWPYVIICEPYSRGSKNRIFVLIMIGWR
jgi:hypothetical protein